MSDFTRRSFLVRTAAAGAAVSAGLPAVASAKTVAAPGNPALGR
ncbi:twin-arginine translocation signal domain-containing protein [Qaidamihabitans albus]|nr:twin-arginine translocation signal domain-containing protein [Qaidamihabitans albus]